jgi:tetratricopeptide (TPR) repeat protein
VRIALESGEVVAGDPAAGEAFVSGSVVSLVARLEGAAEPGQILVGELAARLLAHAATLEPLAPLSLKGWSEPVSAYGLVDVGASAPGVARSLDARLVGRQRELDHLRRELKRASTTGTCRIVSVLGPAGIGKSRLAHELRAGLADGWRVLAGRCLSYGEGTSFEPLRALVEEGAGDLSQAAIADVLEGDPEAARVAATLAAAFEVEDTPATADEISWAFRRFCESLARRQPLLVVLDDLHWASATLLGLVEQLAGASGPMLVTGLARQDLLEEHPLFLAGRPGTSALVLEELAAAETDSLVEEHVPGAAKALRARVREAAGGNPLFVEQLLAFVVETGGGDPTGIPPTIQALLAVRVDRLGPAERAVLERAAVLGREFRFDDVAALLDPGMGATARRHLDGLARRDFVRPDSVDEFRFRNVLIREAVYRSIPKRDRAELHERTADLLDSRGGDGAGDELVGYHLAQAYRWRVDLGPPDRLARGLAAEAGARLGRAAIRAWKLGDVPAATGLFERAVALLPGDDPTRRELLCELGVALRVAGRVDQAEEALGSALEAASAAGDRRIELRATMELVGVGLLHEPEGRAKELLSVAEGAIPAFEAVGDDRALGRAWFLVGFVRGAVRCQNAAWEDAAQRALVHYGRSGWPTATCLGDIAAALYYGPTPVADALARCESLVATQASPLGEANVVVFMGGLAAMCGRFDDARGHVERARFLYEELGHLGTATMSLGAVAGELEVLAGSPQAAADVLATNCEQLAELGGRSHLGSLAAQLADVLVGLGQEEESVRWLAVAEETTATDDVGAQLMSRAVRARVRSREGRPSAARALAQEAVALAARTDWLNMHAKVLLDLAEVLEADGRAVDAAAPVEQALALYRLKGSSVAAERTRPRLDALREQLPQTHGRPRRGLP